MRLLLKEKYNLFCNKKRQATKPGVFVLKARIANPRHLGYKSAPSGKIPEEVTIIDKSVNERLKLIEQLEEEDKNAVYRIIDTMLTKSKFKDFFQKNVAAL